MGVKATPLHRQAVSERDRFFHLERAKARVRYHSQKHLAKLRGIAWEFTFETWLAWWGDDLDNRGPYKHQLCMQRFADAGPYSPENTKKGTPLENGRTRSAVYQNTVKDRPVGPVRCAPEEDSLGYRTMYDTFV